MEISQEIVKTSVFVLFDFFGLNYTVEDAEEWANQKKLFFNDGESTSAILKRPFELMALTLGKLF